LTSGTSAAEKDAPQKHRLDPPTKANPPVYFHYRHQATEPFLQLQIFVDID
jgi:hypothetical protein